MSRSRRWCFTLNNWEPSHEDILKAVPCTYLVYGRETGESGTPHLQGYIIFENVKRFAAVSKIVQAHWTCARTDSLACSNYCKKDGDFHEQGVLPSNSGKRNDLEEFKAAIQGGTFDRATLLEEHSDVIAKYPRFVSEYTRLHLPSPKIVCHPLRDWQARLNVILNREPDDRSVVFVVDPVGNQGKSWFAKYYCSLHPSAVYMRPGKHADMAFALPDVLRVLFLDCTRKQVEYMPYTFLEELKDGLVMCSKYESCIKKYAAVHVVCLMNQQPDSTALSADRYNIIEI